VARAIGITKAYGDQDDSCVPFDYHDPARGTALLGRAKRWWVKTTLLNMADREKKQPTGREIKPRTNLEIALFDQRRRAARRGYDPMGTVLKRGDLKMRVSARADQILESDVWRGSRKTLVAI